jgi:hypothetical protein
MKRARRMKPNYSAPSGLHGFGPTRRRRRHRIGVLERRNPIPTGRYWIDAMGNAAIDKLDAWLVANKATLRLATSEYDPGEAGAFTNPMPAQFVIFEVLSPTPANGLPAYPNVATPSVQTRADTVQRPEPEEMPSLLDAIEAPFKGAGVLLALWVLYELTR